MSSVISHAVVPVALSAWFPADALSPGVLTLGALCSMAPDLDVIGLFLGFRYADAMGHRGFTHSVAFAAGLGALLAAFWPEPGVDRPLAFLFLFLSTLSHPLVDALTDGGQGVALLWPFQDRRFFFPRRPIAVPPIGIRPFFTARGWYVFKSELRWIWLPSALLFGAGQGLRALL
jgi:inner membrane protein